MFKADKNLVVEMISKSRTLFISFIFVFQNYSSFIFYRFYQRFQIFHFIRISIPLLEEIFILNIYRIDRIDFRPIFTRIPYFYRFSFLVNFSTTSRLWEYRATVIRSLSKVPRGYLPTNAGLGFPGGLAKHPRWLLLL